MKRLVRGLRRSRPEAVSTPPPRVDVVPEVPIDLSEVEIWRTTRLPDAGPIPWLDRPDAPAAIDQRRRDGWITAEEEQLCRYWHANGYVIVRGLIDDATLDEAWFAYQEAVDGGAIPLDPERHGPDDDLPGRFLNPHLRLPVFRALMEDRRLVDIVELLLGARAVPFQTISGHKASQQAVHSDSIHMTTYPAGYLVANWIAFEDIEADSGPLEYFPGSHRLPVIYADEIGIPEDALRTSGYQLFDELYTPRLLQLAEEHAEDRRLFTAKKGDVLFWHANLLHGGSARMNFRRSRRALVCHYFGGGCICYHDLSGTLSSLHV